MDRKLHFRAGLTTLATKRRVGLGHRRSNWYIRYVFNPSGTESKKSSTFGMSINDAVGRGTSALFENRGTLLLSKLESVSTPASSVESKDESAFMAFRAATGDRLGLGKHMS